MSELRCIIIEDEPLAAKILSDYIGELPFLQLEAIFRDAVSAAGHIHSSAPDLIFLDIHLPRLKGMDFLRTLRNPPAVIITTAYHQYALEGFELNVVDYLLKPIAFERFVAAVNKVPRHKNTARNAMETVTPERDHLFVMVQKKKLKILYDDILYIESQREYVRIVSTKGELLSKMSTHEIESMLPPALFCRIHRSFIVSIKQVRSYTAEQVDIGGHSLPIGRGYRQVTMDW